MSISYLPATIEVIEIGTGTRSNSCCIAYVAEDISHPMAIGIILFEYPTDETFLFIST